MPRYFFDIADGDLLRDDTGVEFPNAHADRGAAIKSLPHVAQDTIGDAQSRAVVVLMRDENDRVLLTASLTLSVKWLVETA